MKKFAIILLMGGVLLSGCNYLDIVPDERNTPENTYQNPQAAKNYLYSCYSKMPDPRVSEALDKYSAAEIINVIEKSEWVTFSAWLLFTEFATVDKKDIMIIFGQVCINVISF